MEHNWLLEGELYYEYPERINALIDELRFSKDFPKIENPKLLGSGGYKDAWSIGDGKVFVLYQDCYIHRDYEEVYKICNEDKPWKTLEPKMYNMGSVETDDYKFYWAIIEEFLMIKEEEYNIDNNQEVDEKLSEIIIETEHLCNDILEFSSTRARPFKAVDLAFYNEVIGLAWIAYSGKGKKSIKNFCKKEIEIVENHFNLNSHWVMQLIENCMFKICTERDTDLHSANLGFRLGDLRPIFFDW
jgi:hypothetical protein